MNLAGIDMNLVVALHALLCERNVTRAARRLGLGQSATSHALRRLREQLGDPLLVKVGRELALTARATALLPVASAAVAELERVFTRPAAFDPRASRRVFRIAATDNFELYVLPRLARILAAEAPHVDLRFHHLPKDWMLGLARGDFELKLGRKYELGPSLRGEDLVRDRLVCVVRKRHPIGATISLERYAKLSHILVAPGETEGSAMDAVLARAGLTRRVAISVPHFLVALFVVATTDHALTIPERLVEATSPALALRAVPLPFKTAKYTLSQVWHRNSDADEGHRWLRDAIRRALAA